MSSSYFPITRDNFLQEDYFSPNHLLMMPETQVDEEAQHHVKYKKELTLSMSLLFLAPEKKLTNNTHQTF